MLAQIKEKFFNEPNTNYNYMMFGMSFVTVGSVIVLGLNPITLVASVVAPATAGVLAYLLKL
jgi:hypothetical protein